MGLIVTIFASHPRRKRLGYKKYQRKTASHFLTVPQLFSTTLRLETTHLSGARARALHVSTFELALKIICSGFFRRCCFIASAFHIINR